MTPDVADRNDESEQHNNTIYGFGRRRVLQAIGTGVGLSALSGVSGARMAVPDDLIAPPVTISQQAPTDEIDSVFGFSAASADVSPPVEPDHEVQMLIGPRACESAEIPEFFFEPTGLYVEPGDVVQFNGASPHHNVGAYHPGFGFVQRVPDGVPPFSSPLFAPGGYWLYRFDVPGVYEMHCGPHEVFGMVMRIVVGEISGPAAEPLPDICTAGPPTEETATQGPPLRLPDFTAYTVLRDPAIDPEQIVDAGSVSWEQLAPDSKQLFIQPVGFPPCEPSEPSEK